MKMEPGYLFGMALQSIPEPRKIARELFALGHSRRVLWQVLALLLVLGAALGVLSSMVFPIAPELEGSILAMPLVTAIGESAVAVLSVYLIHGLGRAAGGTGTLRQALITMIWLNFVLLMVQVGVFVLSLFAPGIAIILWMGGGIAGFWIMSHFIAEMHGFVSVGKVFFTILLVSFVAVAILSILISLVGVMAGVNPAEFGNV